ncbi:MAG TPA: ABC transporter substrate-binding protein [Pyrinomonadaceae bacterium]|jgi:ABC-type branched-subunit amino acid transport system substrate-binding protein|nr:ABC transporter substrate-binding protein [Pyrinomonadaceae bacterium]
MRTKPFIHQVKFTLATATLLAATLLIVGEASTAQKRSGLTPQEERGKRIYLTGEDKDRGEISAILGSDELEVPGSSFACSSCHGQRGEGTREGGIQPPPLNWETLTRPLTSALTRRERGPYDDATLARAISSGVDPGGARLHPAMPRYRMTGEQVADLVAYLKKLGKAEDAEPGITDETIKVGAALPLTGPLGQVGEDIKATLNASFAEANSRGGIYGRRFELIVEDSRGEPAQTLLATRRLIEVGGIFALVGCFEPADSSEVNELIKRSEVPLIGPVTLSPRLSIPPNPYIFYLLPTFGDQARALIDFVNSRSKDEPARLGVVYAASDFDRDALSGVKAQANIYSMPVVAEEGFNAGSFSAAAVVRKLEDKKTDYVLFFGDAASIGALAAEMDRVNMKAPLLSSVVMIGRGAFSLPASVAARTFLAYPAALPNQSDFAEFISVMQKSGAGLRSPAFQSVAFASTKVFYEAVKLSGRQLDRATLLRSLEQIQDFKTGVMPPVTFGPNRRIGSTGSYIVGIDLDKNQYVPLTDHLIPRSTR